jgi:hypothetical protein
MEPEGSLLCSQELSAGPRPKPDQSSPYHLIPSLYDPFEYYPPTYVFVFLVVLSFWISHQYPIHVHLLTILATCPAHLILLALIILITLGEEYKL